MTAHAIDLGMSNTVVARWNPVAETQETLCLSGLSSSQAGMPPLIPSLVYVEDAIAGSVICGQQVRDRGLDAHPNARFFKSFKRGIGATIVGFQPELDGQRVSLAKTGAWFLQSVVQQLKAQEPDLSTLILTVPVDSFDHYRHWLSESCQFLDIEQIKMIDEPTAAALGYHVIDQEMVLVVDFGGGTLDLSLVHLQPEQLLTGRALRQGAQNQVHAPLNTARVIAKVGRNLGGVDIDHWLANYFADALGVTVNPVTMRLAEQLKIQLSEQPEASTVFFDDQTFDSYEFGLDRSRFHEILTQHQFFQIFDDAIAQLLHQAKREDITAQEINAVLVVGGTGQIPAVQERLCELF